jgi:hypothetical protein
LLLASAGAAIPIPNPARIDSRRIASHLIINGIMEIRSSQLNCKAKKNRPNSGSNRAPDFQTDAILRLKSPVESLFIGTASDGIRTRDLSITNRLHYLCATLAFAGRAKRM